ncbi:MAG: RNA polymerase sigma factor [Bacteroidia bacterium]
MTPQEYNKCVTLYSDRVYRFIKKNLKDELTAEDVMQNSFEILWRKRDEVAFETAKAYLFKVAYHNMIDQIRKTKREVALEEVHCETYGYEDEGYTGRMQLLEKGLALLPEAQRSVVMLRDYEGYSYDEIGTITGLNSSQVKVYIFRARKYLKDFFFKMEGINENQL